MKITLTRLFFAAILSIIALNVNSFAAIAGNPDSSFGNNGVLISPVGTNWNVIRAVAVQPDGKILAGGYAYSGGNLQNPDFALVRFNPNGTLDNSFGVNGQVITQIREFTDEICSIAVLPSGKIIAGGLSNRGSSSQFDPFDVALVRYNPNGSLDTGFGTNGIVISPYGDWYTSARAIGIQRNGKIVVAGNSGVARFNANGTPDSFFGNNGLVLLGGMIANTMTLQDNGKIIAAGRGGNGFNDFDIARLNTDGSMDATFGTNGRTLTNFGNSAEAFSLAIQRNGKIIAAGSVLTPTDHDFALARYNTDGSPDNSFGANGKVTTASGSIASIVIQRNGKILAAGQTIYNGTHTAIALHRYNTNGSLDNSFGNSGKVVSQVGLASFANAIALTRNGRIIAGGASFMIGGNYNFTLVQYRNNPAAHFDYDGDGLSDISVFRETTGDWMIQQSDYGFLNTKFGTSGDQTVPADFTGDNVTDLAVWRPSEGNWYIYDTVESTFSVAHFGLAGDFPAPADYDGDGRCDIAVYRPSTGTWYVAESAGGTIIQRFGTAADKPVATDYDGDGRADLAIFRPSSGEWWIQRSTAGLLVTRFGTAGDKPVQGDYTGDGRSDIAVWRPSSGEWFILRSEDQSYYSVPFGANGDLPSPGDYDGDGKLDTTVFRPSNSTWYSNRSTEGILIAAFGESGDFPVSAAFVR